MTVTTAAASALDRTASPPIGVDELSRAIVAAMPALDATERRVAVTIYRILARGVPAELREIAHAADVTEAQLRALLDDWNGVYRDDEGRVVGFWGLALRDMPHKIEIDGHEIRAWCAWDPLFIVPLLAVEARVRSNDPVTGEEVSLEVTPEGVAKVEPAGAVVSFLTPDEAWDDSVIHTFCHFVLYFASRASGERWTAEHPGTFLVSVKDAFEVGLTVDREIFGLDGGRS